jgi:hypothetical protein
MLRPAVAEDERDAEDDEETRNDVDNDRHFLGKA